MKKFHLLILAACFSGVSSFAFFFSVMPAQAIQCRTERPADARSHWSYRLIDGRKCWYAGKPMLSKSMLHWLPTRTAQARKHDVSNATKDVSSATKAKHDDLDVSDARRLKVLTDENAKLKKLLAATDTYRKLNGLPENYTLMDAQASMPDDSFEARWRARFLDAIEK